MITSLVTGGAGFIGSHVAKHCLRLGHSVIVYDDLSGGFVDNIPDECIFIKGSIDNLVLLDQMFNKYKIDYIYHLAAYAAEGLSHFIRRYNYANNLLGSVNLINLAINYNIKCFVFTSSIAVYGSGQVPMSEATIPQPEDPYGIAKHATELDLLAANKMFGLNYIIFRPHNVYGEHQNISDLYRNVIGIFMNQIMGNKSLTVFGDGEQTRAFSYIGDIAPVIAASVDFPDAYNELFNIGADTPYTINSLVKIIASEFAVHPSVNYVEPRNEVKDAYCDHSKIKSYFQRDALTDLPTGIRQMVAWAKSVGFRKSSRFSNIEIHRNLPSAWL